MWLFLTLDTQYTNTKVADCWCQWKIRTKDNIIQLNTLKNIHMHVHWTLFSNISGPVLVYTENSIFLDQLQYTGVIVSQTLPYPQLIVC